VKPYLILTICLLVGKNEPHEFSDVRIISLSRGVQLAKR
jgi:hypothetical protein